MENIIIHMPDCFRYETCVDGVLVGNEEELKEMMEENPDRYRMGWVYRPDINLIHHSPKHHWLLWGVHPRHRETDFQPPRKVWDEMDAGAWTSSGITYECLRMDRVVRDMRLRQYEPEPFSEIYDDRRLETLSLQVQDDGEDPYDMQALTDMARDEAVEDELTDRAKKLVNLSTAGPLWSWEYYNNTYGVALYEWRQRIRTHG